MNINQRTSEVIKIFKKLRDLKLGIGGFEEFILFRKICNQYIKDLSLIHI